MKIKSFEQNTLSLENFEGPLAFLHFLVQKSEIDIADISMSEITDQYLKYLIDQGQTDLNSGADFIDHTGALIWLKSKMLLPSGITEEELAELNLAAPFDIIPQLIEYCKFKELAKELTKREDGNEGKFVRGMTPVTADFPSPIGIERISLEELQNLMEKMLLRASEKKVDLIPEEEWRVRDKIETLRSLIRTKETLHFYEAFTKDPSKTEVIVTFIGLLELMKIGVLVIYKGESGEILMKKGEEDE